MNTFKIGDTVRWVSQAGGSTKDKTGEIVAIVEPGDRPSRVRFAEMHTGAGVGRGRKVISYVVKVGNKHYWPRTSALQPADGQDDLSGLRESVRKLVGECDEFVREKGWRGRTKACAALTEFLAEHPEFRGDE